MNTKPIGSPAEEMQAEDIPAALAAGEMTPEHAKEALNLIRIREQGRRFRNAKIKSDTPPEAA